MQIGESTNINEVFKNCEVAIRKVTFEYLLIVVSMIVILTLTFNHIVKR